MILIFGYQSVGHACFEALWELGERELHVVTHRDRPGETIWWSSLADAARAVDVPVTYSEDLDREALIEFVRELRPQLIYSFYYRDMLPTAALRVADLGAYNMHGSLLPAYRGRCPVNWAVLNGATETGVTLHHMVARADAGDIVGQRAVPIGPRDTALDVFHAMVPAARALLAELHPQIVAGTAPRIPQDESRATTFGGRRPEDGAIDWSRSASDIDALVRAVAHPYPGAFGEWEGRRFYVWRSNPVERAESAEPGQILGVDGGALLVACGEGALRIERASYGDGPELAARELAGPVLPGGELAGSVLSAGRGRA
ncbi:MAG: formyltransferase [Planctomycetes bacterium]|nr:formyltransferase [Planctomycetota bacterium]